MVDLGSKKANTDRDSKMKWAKLRCCASCEWIFSSELHQECPMCGFGSYGARYVYGNKAYTYKHTQEPWMEKKLDKYKLYLLRKIKEHNDIYNFIQKPLDKYSTT